MNWLRRLRDWWRELCVACGEPWPEWEDDYPDSTPPTLEGFDCPDTEPTSPGALDTLPGRLQ